MIGDGMIHLMSLLTTAEVATRFKVGQQTVRRWVKSGRLTPTVITLGGQFRFDEAAIAALSTAQEEGS